ncbi:MAG: alpha-2-macroglobulin family protein [Acidimicrobiia bacterium]|nr:alpha-2-macroglobulin family protein [Acidimicrobiia bacterium]
MPVAAASRRPRLLAGGLVVVLVFALVAAMCMSRDDTEPTTTVAAPSSPAVPTAVQALAPPGQPLSVRLSAGSAVNLVDPGPITLVEGEPLDDATVAAILERLPEWVIPQDDRLEFRRPAETLAPPRSGATIDVPFPAPGGEPTPTVAAGPLEVLRFQPEGRVAVAPYISITFNQPMVPLATVGQLDSENVPVVVTPDLPGRWEWIGTRTLRFDHDSELIDRLPMATVYRVEIPAGTTSQTGGELAEPVSWTFKTPPPQVESFQPSHDSLPLEPVFLVDFDQRIDPVAVLETITITTGTVGGEAMAIRLATEEEIAADERVRARVDGLLADRWLAFRATAAFAPDTQINIQIGPGTPSAEGPRATANERSFTARTYAPLRVSDSSCRGRDRCGPGDSLSIRFNNVLELEGFDASMVAVEPEPAGLTVQAWRDTISISGATIGGTTYTATIDPTLTDTHGQTLGGNRTVEFRINDARPSLNQFRDELITLDPLVPEPTLAVASVNHDELRVRVFRVDPNDWGSYVAYLDRRWDDQPPPIPSSWAQVSDEIVDTNSKSNELTETAVDLSDALEGDVGHVVVLVEPVGHLAGLTRDSDDYWRNQPAIVWAQSTVIGAAAISDADEIVAWATDLRSGEPLPDVEVGFTGYRATAVTNGDGLARVELPQDDSIRTGLLVARRGDDRALIDANWRSNVRDDEAVWYVFDDRGVYRPDETVHVKGWVRRIRWSDDAQLAAVTGDATVGYTAADSSGNEVASGTVDLNAFGGFDFEIDVPANANLGQATIDLTLQGVAGQDRRHSHRLQIQEFRRPDFEVAVRPESAGPYLVGEPATAAVTAEYFAGGPLTDAEVRWVVRTQPATYSPPGWDDFTFGVWVPWWSRGDSGGSQFRGGAGFDGIPGRLEPDEVKTFSGRTDAGGTHYLQMDFDGDGEGLPTTVSADATVFDVNRQGWSDGTDLLVHPGEFYVGLSSRRTFVDRGEPLLVEAIATDIDGTAVAGRTVIVKAGRTEWLLMQGRWEQVPVAVETCVVTSSDEPVECEFSAEVGGRYQIIATVADNSDRTSKTEITRWVGGDNRRPERNVVQEEVTLVPDKREYTPGDDAEILVASPFGPAEGLVTISRNGIVSTERFTIDDTSTVLSVPIEDGYIPNVHVQVDLVGTTARTADNGDPLPGAPERPAFAVGALKLSIPPLSRTLTVTAVPSTPLAEPGSDTQVEVTVTDASGNPVDNAELAVVVADEAVLALGRYELPDPISVFYASINPRIKSRYLRNSIELVNPQLLTGDDSFATATTVLASGQFDEFTSSFDGGFSRQSLSADAIPTAAQGREESAEAGIIGVRTRFDALAVFAPDVTTGVDGTATVDVSLPDSLTRYRVMVVAVEGTDRFGTAESNITARLPLMIRPSAPRFLNFGDAFEVPVVIQNQTDTDLEVDAVIQTSNLTLTAGAGRRVTVPANDRIEVRFPAAAEDAGTARLRVAAIGGTYADAASVSLPVYTPATTEAFATYGVVDDGVIAQPVLTPEAVVPQFGGLEINTSSTALQALTDAVIYLNDYRYASSDGLASRILAIAALRDVLDAFDADGLPPAAELAARVDGDITALLALQTDRGGFAIWRSSNQDVPYHSIQATHALVEAKANGYAVPADRLERALKHLRNIENRIPKDYSQRMKDTLSAYALYVRDLAGERDATKAGQLYARAGDTLSLDAVARLWPVLNDPDADAEIERLFTNRATETAGAATFTTDYGEDAYLILHSNRRTDGIILDALIAKTPDSDLIPKVVAGLLGNQTRGRWHNVQENSFILLALNEYFDTFESTTPDFVARIWLGDLYAAEHVFTGRTTDRDLTSVPMEELIDQTAGGAADIVVAKDGPGRLYYRLGLRYAPDDLELDPLDRGFVVQRTYEAVEDPDDVTRDPDGAWRIRPGAEVRVRVTMVADSRRTHVALIDPMPAGFESLNPALAVTAPLPPAALREDAARLTYWWWRWFEHQNLRDDRAEAFATLLRAGTYEYTYVARATTPGTFIVPPTTAEEIYAPETFGRSGSDVVIIESR